MTKTTKWLDLLINGKSRKAEAMKENGQYVVIVPAAELVDGSGTGEQSPAVQGHSATFDKDGVLLGVDALGWNAEGGFYKTNWPTKADSLYNANAAKTYAPQVFKQVKKNGGWLTKYQLGGEAPQQTQAEDKQLLALVTSAYKEVASGKLGESFMYVAQLLQDSQGAAKLDSLRTQIPELEEMLSAIEEVAFQQSAYMKKGGCAKKKKVKKGAKGCVPCKKLMKVGGKLVNVLTDCEGNIIHKHQVGGWIRKAEDGMLTQRRNAILNTGHTKDWLTQQEGITKTGVGKKYYQGADGFMYSIEGTASGWRPAVKLGQYIQSEPGGVYQLTDGQGNLIEGGHTIDTNAMIAAADAVNAEKAYTSAGNTQQYYDPTTKKWYNATYNMQTKAWDTTGEATHDNFGDDDVYSGGNWQAGTITREGATAAGIDGSQFNIDAPTVRGVKGKAGNSLFGETASGPTAQDYIDQYGFQGALQNEARLRSARLLSAKNDRRAARRAAWQNGLVGNGQLNAIRQAYRDTRDEIKSQHKAQTAALLNRYTSRDHSTIGAQNLASGTMTHKPAPTGSTPGAKPEEYTVMQRQGGWLNQF